jgi:rubrerythrin
MAMAQAHRPRSVKVISQYNADDYMWGIPESPEFSVVHRLINEFQTQEGDEDHWLSIYKRIAEDSPDPMIRFLLNMIIADEERHQQLIGRMISTLKDDLASARTSEPSRATAGSGTTARDLAMMVEHLLKVERKGIKEYEKLKNTSQRYSQHLLALLCESMVYDSRKHIGILNFLRTQVKGKTKAEIKKKTPQAAEL